MHHTARVWFVGRVPYAFRLFVSIGYNHAIATQIDNKPGRFRNIACAMSTYNRIFCTCRFFVRVFQLSHITRCNGWKQHTVYGRFVITCGRRNRINRGYGCTQQFGQFGQINIILGHFCNPHMGVSYRIIRMMIRHCIETCYVYFDAITSHHWVWWHWTQTREPFDVLRKPTKNSSRTPIATNVLMIPW